MKIKLSGNRAQMAGDWTLTGVTQSNVNSLAAALQQIENVGVKTLQVDCGHVSAIDTTGKQLLDVWMQCARFRGVEPELINPPRNLRDSFKLLGLHYRNTNSCPGTAVLCSTAASGAGDLGTTSKYRR